MHLQFPRRGVAAFVLAAVAATSAVLVFAGTASGQQTSGGLSAPLGEGDVAISGFSGATLLAPTVPVSVDPLADKVIDPNGSSLKIFDLSTLGGPTVGQMVDAPAKLMLPADAIGQVFALAFDDGNGTGVPNLYAAATSAYGLQIVGAPGADGVRPRLKQGGLGAAFMAGQFGSIPGASPGSIYKIDGMTGAVTMFADTAFSGVPNTGAGIGGIAFDSVSHDLYASDLDTGLIHRFNTLAPGADLGQFDHGTTGRPAGGLAPVPDDGKTANISSPGFLAADPSTWGFTQAERRVTALALHSGRLYYAVADVPSVWSVGLNADGSFGSDPRLELQVQGTHPYAIASLAFDPAGDMVIAQRGTQASPFDYGQFTAPEAEVLQYAPAPAGTSGRWSPTPGEYAVGLPDGSRMSTGGVALADGYNPDGSRGTACGATLLTTGDDLRDNADLAGQLPPGPANVAGVQIDDASLLAPQNVPPVQSAFLAFDPNAAPSASGHAGAVAVVSCLGGSAAPAGSVVNPSASANPATGNGTTAPGTQPAGGGGTTAPANQTGRGGTTAATQPLTVSKTATATTCTETGGCSFAITVHNPNRNAVPGPFAVQDTFTAGGAQLTQSKITSRPESPWTCTSATAGGSLTCTDPGPVQPGDTTFNLTFAPGQTGNATDVVNCVGPGGPNATPVNLPPVPPATLPAPAATVTFKDNFDVSVQPDNVGQCSSSDGSCKFQVSAGPEGASTPVVQGPLVFKITASLGADPAPVKFDADELEMPKGATCQPAANDMELDCTTADAGVMTDADAFELSIKTTLPATGAGALVLHASVQGPQQGDASWGLPLTDGAAKGGANPDAGITQQFAGPQCATIPLDKSKDLARPPATVVNGLSIAKALSKDPGPCTVGSTCSFDVTVTNTTAATMPGPIDIKDVETLFGGIPISSAATSTATGPFTCTPDGLVLDCIDNDSLSGGQQLTETFTVPVTAALIGPEGQNCALIMGGTPACAAFPTPANPPSKGLTIKKAPGTAAAPVDGIESCTVGQPCNVNIAVTNTGTTDFPGPVVFTDLGIPGEGTLDGGNIAEPSAADALTCTSGNPSTCTFDGKIPAGQTQSFDLHFTMTDAGGLGSTQIQNCAFLEGETIPPQGLDTTHCINIDVTGPTKPANNQAPAAPQTGLDLSIKANEASCEIGQSGCSFTVIVGNSGLQALPGPFAITPEVQATATGEIGTILDSHGGGPGWDCTANNGEQCIDNSSVGAAANLPPATLSYTVAPSTKGTVLTVCVRPSVCASVALVQPPMLKITKMAPGETGNGDLGTCALDAPCTFTVTVQNTGGTTLIGTLILDDKLNAPAAAISTATSADPWICAPQQNAATTQCIDSRMSLAPGASTTFQISATPGAGWSKGNVMTNCVSINAGGDNFPLDPASQICGIAKLDPFNVQVTKTGDQSCEPGADCHFSLTLFDPGPIDHDAPVTITDKLSIGSAPITSVSPPLPCATQPTQVPFTCTSPGNFPMKVGESHTYNLTVQLPAGQTSYQNCAVVGPNANGDANIELGAKQSCVTTLVQPKPASHLVIQKTGPATCTPGQACAFSISITNSGNTVFAGPVSVADNLDIGTAPIVGGFALCATAPSSVPFRCTTAPLRLAPGTSTSSAVVVQLPDTTATSATNCAILDELKGAMGAQGDDKSCVTVALNQGNGGSNGTLPATTPPAQSQIPPPPPGGLTLVKTGDATCTAGGSCNFTLTLVGPPSGDYDGPLDLYDEEKFTGGPPPAGTAQAHKPQDQIERITAIQPPLPCATQPFELPFACSSAGNIHLVARQQQSYRMTVQIPAAYTQTALMNCAGLGSPPTIVDVNGTSNFGTGASCVTVAITQPTGNGGYNEVLPGGDNPAQCPAGTGGVPPNCQPTNGQASLSILKSADQPSCTPGGICNFTVTIKNPGTAAFTGTLHLHDALDISGQVPIASIQPPLPCTTQPQSLPLDCTAGDTPPYFSLGAGQSLTYHIGVYLPPTTATQASNCVQMQATPTEMGYLGLFSGPVTACATVALTPSTGNGGSNGIVSQQPQACFSNMVPDGNGGCQCPANTTWDGKQCTAGEGGANGINPQPVPPVCPIGTTGTPPDCVAATVTPKPSTPKTAPVLKCPANTTGTYPKCVPVKPKPQVQKCPAGMVGSPPACSCPRGTQLSRSGRSCVPLQPNASGNGGLNFSFGNGGPNISFGNGGGFSFPNGGKRGQQTQRPTGNGGANGTKQQTTTTTTTLPSCPANSVGTYPQCVCNGAMQLQYRMDTNSCVPYAVPTPTPPVGGFNGVK